MSLPQESLSVEPQPRAGPNAQSLRWCGNEVSLMKVSADVFCAIVAYYCLPPDAGFLTALGRILLAPLTRIKLLLQTQHSHPRTLDGSVQPYTGIRDCASRQNSELGALALWRGCIAQVLAYVVYSFVSDGLYFLSYPLVQKLPIRFDFVVGIPLVILVRLVVNCFALAHVRLATDLGSKIERDHASVWGCLSQAFRTGGFPALLQGYPASLASGIIRYGFGKFVMPTKLFEAGILPPVIQGQGWNELRVILNWQLTVVLTRLLVYPFETVSARLMLQDSKGEKMVYANTADCCRQIVREEGYRGFFQGATVALLVHPACAVVLQLLFLWQWQTWRPGDSFFEVLTLHI